MKRIAILLAMVGCLAAQTPTLPVLPPGSEPASTCKSGTTVPRWPDEKDLKPDQTIVMDGTCAWLYKGAHYWQLQGSSPNVDIRQRIPPDPLEPEILRFVWLDLVPAHLFEWPKFNYFAYFCPSDDDILLPETKSGKRWCLRLEVR